jgi:hypothetical protein
MHHVDAHDGIRRIERPLLQRSIQRNRRHNVIEPGGIPIGRDRRERILLRIGRVPVEIREARGEMHDMLARAAGNLQHTSSMRQFVRQHIGNRCAVALGSGAFAHRHG